MIVNPKIKELLIEIEKKSISYANTPDKERKYLKRLLDIYKTNLTENEQLYIFKIIIELLHYKNIITDPDNIIQLHNIKLRTYTYIMFLIIIIMLVAAGIFKLNDSIANIFTIFNNIFKILTF